MPVVLIFDLLGFASKTAVQLGYWPSYGNPDPKQLPFGHELVALQIGWMIIPVVSFCAIGVAILARLSSREFPLWPVIFITVLSFALFQLYSRLDPGGMVDWLWD